MKKIEKPKLTKSDIRRVLLDYGLRVQGCSCCSDKAPPTAIEKREALDDAATEIMRLHGLYVVR